MSRAPYLVVAALAAACGPSGAPLNVYYDFQRGAEQTCVAEDGDPVVDCTEVPMTCDSVALLRIVDPDNGRVWVDQCGVIPNFRLQHDLCPITQAFTPINPIPTKRLAVQMAVYSLADLDTHPEDLTPICPANVEFTATGFVKPTSVPLPALAGMAYTDGFDDSVTVTLGCNDSGLIDTIGCRNERALDFTASILDFDNQISISENLGDLSVRVGQPKENAGVWTLDVASTFELPLVDDTPPTWGAANVNIDLTDYLCIQVLEVDSRATTSVTCRTVTAPLPTEFDLIGFKVSDTTLDEVIAAMGLPDFPDAGMVVGIVVDQAGDPVPGVTISDSAGSTIRYLTANRLDDNAAATTTAGIFMSTNAPFESAAEANHWVASEPDHVQVNDPIGGMIASRLTVVVIRMNPAL